VGARQGARSSKSIRAKFCSITRHCHTHMAPQ
jgi:hypothetical protein